MSKLSEDQIAVVDHALAERRVTSKCLSCGDKQLHTDGFLYELPGFGAAGSGDASICVARLCDHCGYVQHYSIKSLGLEQDLNAG